jgi:hypothetical protein
MAARKSNQTQAPWEKKVNLGHGVHLSTAEKRAAKARAKKAGRPYPNLVDNLWEMKHHDRKTMKRNPALTSKVSQRDRKTR